MYFDKFTNYIYIIKKNYETLEKDACIQSLNTYKYFFKIMKGDLHLKWPIKRFLL